MNAVEVGEGSKLRELESLGVDGRHCEFGWGVNLVRWSRWESTGDTGRHRETQTAGVMLERAGVVGSHPGRNIRSRWETWKWW